MHIERIAYCKTVSNCIEASERERETPKGNHAFSSSLTKMGQEASKI